MAYEIFLSHSHQDEVIATALAGLVEELFEKKVNVRYSSDQSPGGGIPPGTPWLDWILEHIKRADKTYVLLTANSLKRPWVLWEAGAAVGIALGAEKTSAVAPVLFAVEDNDIPSPFEHLQVVRGDSDKGIRRLLQDLNTALGGPLSPKAFSSTVADCVPPYLRGVKESLNSMAPADGVLASMPPLVPPVKLAGLWVTAYTFHSSAGPAHHADLSQVVAEPPRRVRATNYAQRTEGHVAAFGNQIEAEVVNRHLIGQWRNDTDTRYFGTIHLAILPGESVMEGHYTSLANDVTTSVGHWKWVRLKPLANPPNDLNALSLLSPPAVYKILEGHKQSDGPLSLDAVLEKK